MTTHIKPEKPAPASTPKTNGSAASKELYTAESVNEAIRKLQSLADIQLKLQKERKAIESLDLIQKMLDGELLSENELVTVKASLKGLSKYATLHTTYKTCLEDAQQARDLIDHILGSPFKSI